MGPVSGSARTEASSVACAVKALAKSSSLGRLMIDIHACPGSGIWLLISMFLSFLRLQESFIRAVGHAYGGSPVQEHPRMLQKNPRAL